MTVSISGNDIRLIKVLIQRDPLVSLSFRGSPLGGIEPADQETGMLPLGQIDCQVLVHMHLC